MEPIITHFTDEGIRIEQGSGQAKKTKYVSLPTYLKVLNDNLPINFGLLPKGIIALRKEGPTTFAAICTPPAIKNVSYIGNTDRSYHFHRFTIPVPHLLWIFRKVDKDEYMRSAKVFAANTDMITPDTPLSHAPFSNVAGDGDICFGNRLPKVGSQLISLQAIPDIFFSYTFNADLDYTTNGTFQLFTAINNQKEFPNDVLQNTRCTSFGSVWGNI